VNVIAATLMLAAHWQYATANGHLVDRDLDPRITRLASRRIVSSAIAYTAALVLALIWPVVALTVYLVVPLVNILPYSIDKHFRSAETPTTK
jgi:heme O synthase-like polyprenyltransferase